MKEKELLLKLKKQGLNLVEIGKKIGCTRNAVRRRMIKYGIYEKPKKAHPELIENFFENIDSKQKAYWLGFLYADGYIKNNRLSVDLSLKDKKFLEKFCKAIGLDVGKIKIRHHYKKIYSCQIRVYSKKMIEDLIKHNCVNKKSLVIRLPEFENDNLNLAFLLGYYDGDGYSNSTVVCCGAKKFLQDIKNKYNLEYGVIKKERVFILTLGVSLKNRMLENYEDSMLRKRETYVRKNYITKKRILKFEVDKETLEKMIAEKSYVEIGKIFGVSDNAVRKRALKLEINLSVRRK